MLAIIIQCVIFAIVGGAVTHLGYQQGRRHERERAQWSLARQERELRTQFEFEAAIREAKWQRTGPYRWSAGEEA